MKVKIIDFLKRFIWKQKTSKNIPNEYLKKILKEEENEYIRGNFSGPFRKEEVLKFLKSL